MTRNKSLFSNLFLLIAAVVWGLAFSSQKIGAAHVPPFALNCVRLLIAGICLIPVIVLTDRFGKTGRYLLRLQRQSPLGFTRTEWIAGASLGFVLFLAAGLQQFGLMGEHVGPGKASFLTALYVTFVPLLGLLRRKIAPLNVWVSVGIAVFGAYLLTSGGIGSLSLGIYEMVLLLSAFSYAVHITLIDYFAPQVDVVRVCMIQFLVAGLINLLFTFLFDARIAFAPTWEGIYAAMPSLLFLGVISGGVGYTFQAVGQKLSGTPTIASLIMSLESVFGLIGGALLPQVKEHLNSYQLGGCAAIFTAVVFSQLPLREWYRKWRARHTRASETIPAASEEDSPDHPN